MTTYGSKGGKGLDKLGKNQQMQINWGDVRNIRSIQSSPGWSDDIFEDT